tara:strand:- start:249 stop:962 length:714 start_codon:yes stop_codon:yes gene_type:complete
MKNYLKSKFPNLLNVYYFFRFYIRFFYRKQVRHHILWKATFGDKRLYKNLNLNSDSLFFDVGAHEGSVTSEIYNTYKCNIYSFEPDKETYNNLASIYEENDKVSIYNFALSNFSGRASIDTEYGSESFKLINDENSSNNNVEVKNIVEFISDNKLEKIDVLKLNVEGSEFEILNILISSKFINKIECLIIQFHKNTEKATEERERIIKNLNLTHKNEFSYYFVWEKWNIRQNNNFFK